MKKSVLSVWTLFLIWAAALMIPLRSSYALFGIPGPFTPTVDAPTDAGFSIKSVGATLSSASSSAVSFMKEQVQAAKAAKKAYEDQFTGMLPKKERKERKNVPGSKTIKETKVCNIYKPASVKKAFYKLFLAYPSDRTEVKTAYRRKSQAFYEDTVIEMYASVRELEKELEALKVKIAGLTDTLLGGGGDGAETGDDNNGAWKNAYIAYDTLNELLQITEELTAMKAQLDAAIALRDFVQPADYVGKKTSWLADEKIKVASAPFRVKKSGAEVLAFAQVSTSMIQMSGSSEKFDPSGQIVDKASYRLRQEELAAGRSEAIGLITGKTSPAASQKTEAGEEGDYENYEYDPETQGAVKFETSVAPDTESPFAGNRAKLEELNKLDDLYTDAKQALEIHNLMQSLKNYQDMFKKYDDIVKLHNRSLEMLKASDQCVIRYLGRYYDDPEKVWAGGPIGDNVSEYALRSGISGWAVAAFEAAKEEQTNAMDTDSVQEIEVDADIDTGDLSNLEENKKRIEEQDLSNTMDPQKKAESEKTNREAALLAWKIGAEAAKSLAEDQYSSSPKWGRPKEKFPIWRDQKNFYNQYIDGKYENMKNYLNMLDFGNIALNIAQELNKDTESSEIRQYNTNELNKLAALLERMGKEEKTDENAAEASNLSSARSREISEAQRRRDEALKPLQEKKEALEKDLSAAAEALKSYNERINQLKNEALEAEASAEVMTDQLEYLDDVEGGEIENTETYIVKDTETVEKAIAPVSETEDGNAAEPQPQIKSLRRKFKSSYLLERGAGGSEILAFAAMTGIADDALDLQTKTYTRTVEHEMEIVNEEDSVQQTYTKEVINSSREKTAAAEAEVKSLQEKAAVMKGKISDLQAQITLVQQQIDRINGDYAEEVRKIENKHNSGLSRLIEKIRKNRENSSEDSSVVSSTLLGLYKSEIESSKIGDLIGTSHVKSILGKSDAMIADTKNYAAQAIEKAKEDIYKLGDDLYLPKSNSLVVQRHKELIEELKNIPLQQLADSSSAIKAASGKTAVTGALTTLFQQVLLEKACADKRCETPDDEYFVGLPEKDRDFSAPKAAPAIYLPPLREVFHFDDADYKNVYKTADGFITKDGLLNYGGEIPAVWKLILRDKAFVEKDVDMEKLTEGEGKELFLMRGGRLPCRSEGKVLDVDPYTGQYMVLGKLNYGGIGALQTPTSVEYDLLSDRRLPNCQEIGLIRHAGILSRFEHSVEDYQADTKGPASIQKTEKDPDGGELGTLVKFSENGLKFTDKQEEVFARIEKIEEESSAENSSYKKNLKDELYQRAPYDTNQFGDFLNFVELEMTYRQTMEELSAGIEEAKATLNEALQKVGFSPSEQFNLSTAADFELARSNLDRAKNRLVNDAFSRIAEVDVTDNEVVEERLNNIKSIFTALRKDKDELIALSEVSPSDSELDEQIKTEEVNQSVVGEYGKKADEEFQKQLNSFKRPYCAAY